MKTKRPESYSYIRPGPSDHYMVVFEISIHGESVDPYNNGRLFTIRKEFFPWVFDEGCMETCLARELLEARTELAEYLIDNIHKNKINLKERWRVKIEGLNYHSY